MTADDDFHAERSHREESDANKIHSNAGQIAILVNGGAASALLAFISNKDNFMLVKSVAGIALGGFAMAILFGACAVFALGNAARARAVQWQHAYYDPKDENRGKLRASRWQRISIACWIAALAIFAGCSILLASRLFS